MSEDTVLVTGGAGFIGSHLVRRLVTDGHKVIVLDNFSSGKRENLADLETEGKIQVAEWDVTMSEGIGKVVKGCETVFHLAANPEVRLGDPAIHFETNIRGTFNVLEAMRKNHGGTIVFASSSTVYGDASVIPTSETYSPLKPISVYGAAKLAGESLISAYCASYGLNGVVLRYANVVGPKQNHGIIYDFAGKLKGNRRELEILGDGTQRKSYLNIDDAVAAAVQCWKQTGSKNEVYNVGSDDDIDVKRIADIVVQEMGLAGVAYKFTGGIDGGRGWKGDVKYMRLDVGKLKSLGWRPKYGSEMSVRLACRSLVGK
jgi:UDP-glucose 4-epimerase